MPMDMPDHASRATESVNVAFEHSRAALNSGFCLCEIVFPRARNSVHQPKLMLKCSKTWNLC